MTYIESPKKIIRAKISIQPPLQSVAGQDAGLPEA